MDMSRRTLEFVLVLSTLIAICGPLMAGTPSATVRGYVDYASPTSDTTLSFFDLPTTIEADTSAGLSFFYEIRLKHRLGLEVGLMFSGFDFRVTQFDGIAVDEAIGDAAVIPMTFGVDFHLLGEKTKPDLYIAPLVSINLWGELEYEGQKGDLEVDFGYGAVVGLDIPIGSGGWQFCMAVRYLTMKADDGQNVIDVDPMFVQVGAGYRF